MNPKTLNLTCDGSMGEVIINGETSMNQPNNAETLSDREKASFHLKVIPNRTAQPAGEAAAPQTLRDTVALALKNYFAHLDGQPVNNIYDMVLSEIEPPLLEAVLKYTRNNQSKASILLGLNRGTLRKKLQTHGLL